MLELYARTVVTITFTIIHSLELIFLSLASEDSRFAVPFPPTSRYSCAPAFESLLSRASLILTQQLIGIDLCCMQPGRAYCIVCNLAPILCTKHIHFCNFSMLHFLAVLLHFLFFLVNQTVSYCMVKEFCWKWTVATSWKRALSSTFSCWG